MTDAMSKSLANLDNFMFIRISGDPTDWPHPTALLWRCQLNEFASAILSPGRFVMADDGRLDVAIADRIQTIGFNSHAREFFAQRERAAFAQRAVVFFRASLIAMALDLDCS